MNHCEEGWEGVNRCAELLQRGVHLAPIEVAGAVAVEAVEGLEHVVGDGVARLRLRVRVRVRMQMRMSMHRSSVYDRGDGGDYDALLGWW